MSLGLIMLPTKTRLPKAPLTTSQEKSPFRGSCGDLHMGKDPESGTVRRCGFVGEMCHCGSGI